MVRIYLSRQNTFLNSSLVFWHSFPVAYHFYGPVCSRPVLSHITSSWNSGKVPYACFHLVVLCESIKRFLSRTLRWIYLYLSETTMLRSTNAINISADSFHLSNSRVARRAASERGDEDGPILLQGARFTIRHLETEGKGPFIVHLTRHCCHKFTA